MVRIVGITLLAGCLAVLLVCSSATNPYLDPSLSTLELTNCPYADNGTLPIFQTFSFTCEILLQSYLDSVRIHVDNNRLWTQTDSTIRDMASAASIQTFTVSFSDTGYNTIRVVAWKTTGDSLVRSLRLYCTSPLRQKPVISVVGQTVTLKTPPVADNNVLYNWNFQGINYPSTSDSLTITLTKAFLTIFTGELFVSSNGVRSPAIEFPLMIDDDNTSVITCLNRSTRNDSVHIYTSASPFFFRVKVTNQALNQGTVSILPRVNGMAFDEYTTDSVPGTLICGKTIIDSALVSNPDDSLLLFVTFSSSDGSMLSKTYWVHYDPTMVNLDLPEIVLSVPGDNAVVSNPAIKLQGAVIYNNYAYDSLYLAFQLNNTLMPQGQGVNKSAPKWSADMVLPSPGLNNLTVSAYDNSQRLGNSVAAKSFRINYNPSAIDTTPPSINEIRAGGRIVAGAGTYFMDSALVHILVNATDFGSGVRAVSVNTSAARALGSDNFLDSILIEHKTAGTAVTVIARDSSNNSQASFTLIKNAKTSFAHVPAAGGYAVAGKAYTDSIRVNDSDGDPAQISLHIQTALSDTQVTMTSSAFTWTWGLGDIGKTRNILVHVWDGFEFTDTTFSVLVVSPDSQPAARFITQAIDFPESLQVARDTLRMKVGIDQNIGSGYYSLNARILETGLALPFKNRDSLYWIPQPADTGLKTILIILSSGAVATDSISVQVRVKPPVLLSFANGLDSARENSGTVYLPLVLSRASRDTVRALVTVSATSSAPASKYTLPSALVTFAPESLHARLAVILVNDTIVSGTATLTLNLSSPAQCLLGAISSHTLTILDDDTLKVVRDTPQVSFLALDSTGGDSARITIPVALTAKAWTNGLANIQASGSAVPGVDYTLAPQNQISFAPGDSVKFLTLTLLRSARMPILFIGDTLNNQMDNAVADTFTAMNYAIVPRSLSGITDSQLTRLSKTVILTLVNPTGIKIGAKPTYTYTAKTPLAAIYVSQSVAAPSADTLPLFRTKTPVVCAKTEYWKPLKLITPATPTGKTSVLSFTLRAGNPVINATTQSVTAFSNNTSRPLPWATLTSGSVAVTSVSGTAGNNRVIFSYAANQTLPDGATLAPGRRVAMGVLSTADGGSTPGLYAASWWPILKKCMKWCETGVQQPYP